MVLRFYRDLNRGSKVTVTASNSNFLQQAPPLLQLYGGIRADERGTSGLSVAADPRAVP